MAEYYQASNRFAPTSFIFFLIAILTAVPILATIYALAIWYIPFPYINFILTGAFAMGIGMVIQFSAVKYGKVRNSKLALLFGFLGSLMGLYFAWVAWCVVAMNASTGTNFGHMISGIISLALDPTSLIKMIQSINTFGVWGFGENPVTGTFLWIIWAIEAIAILFIGSRIPISTSKEPFCEVNNKWFESKNFGPFNYIENTSNLIDSFTSSNVSELTEPNKVDDHQSKNHSIFTLYANETNENFLTVTNRVASLNDKNEVKFDDQQVIRHLSIPESVSQFIENR